MWCCWIVDRWPRPGGPRCRTGVDRGGTERALAEAGLLVTAVSDVTGFPGWRQRGARRIAAGRHETQPTDEGWIAQRRGVGFAEKESSRGLSCAPTDRTRASTAGTAAPVCTGRADARRHSDGSDADRRFRGGAEYLRPGLAGEGEQFGGDGGPAGRRRPQPDLHLDEGPTPPSGALHGRRRSGRDPSTRSRGRADILLGNGEGDTPLEYAEERFARAERRFPPGSGPYRREEAICLTDPVHDLLPFISTVKNDYVRGDSVRCQIRSCGYRACCLG